MSPCWRRTLNVMRYALLLGTIMLVLGCSGGSDPDTSPHERLRSARAIDGWQIKVSARPSIVSPIVLSVGPARAAPQNDAHPWVQHELILENRGNRLFQFADTDSSAFIGAPGTQRLIAADEGCGYSPQTVTSPIEARVCTLSLDVFAIKPHARVSRTITLFKGLRGMEPLTPGTYTFKRVIRFRAGRKAPAAHEGRGSVINIRYRLTRR
jgi:hypothetical protein